MKVAYVVDGRMPTEKANGYQSSQMCQALIESGCDLKILLPTRIHLTRESISKNTTIESYYGLRVKLDQIKLPSIDFIYILSSLGLVSEKSLMSILGSVLTSWGLALSLAAHLFFNQYDVIYIRSHHLLIALLKLLPKRKFSKVFFEVHYLPERQLTLKYFIGALSKIGGVVAITNQLKCKLILADLPEYKIVVAHDGVDLSTFDMNITKNDARHFLKINPERKIAAFIGKFHTNSKEKGIPEIILSAKYLFDEDSSIDFMFVGGPLELLKNYEKIIFENSLPRERFIFIEKQPIRLVPYYLKASDVLLMPHPWSKFYAYYISPLKLFEYMSSGRPIIASNLPSIKEVLKDRFNALLSNAGDPKSIANCIKIALSDVEMVNKITNQAYTDVKQYTWNVRAKKILEFIDNKKQELSLAKIDKYSKSFDK